MTKTLYVVVEEELDYDWEETPFLTDVKLVKAFTERAKAEEMLKKFPVYQIKEVLLDDN